MTERSHRGAPHRHRHRRVPRSRPRPRPGARRPGWHVVTDGRDARSLHAAVDDLPGVTAVAGDVTDARHREELVAAAGGRIDLVVNNAGGLGPSPLPPLADYPLDALVELFAVNVVAPLGLIQAALPHLAAGAVVVDITSDASVEAYEGWGGYGATKAALDHLGRVLAVERPDLRVLTIDPGDMRTQMHQDAFPGEDISDRPPPDDERARHPRPRRQRRPERPLPRRRCAVAVTP